MKTLLEGIWFWLYMVPRFVVIFVTVIYKRRSSIYYWIGDRLYSDQELVNDICEWLTDKVMDTKNSNRVIIKYLLKMIDLKKESTAK